MNLPRRKKIRPSLFLSSYFSSFPFFLSFCLCEIEMGELLGSFYKLNFCLVRLVCKTHTHTLSMQPRTHGSTHIHTRVFTCTYPCIAPRVHCVSITCRIILFLFLPNFILSCEKIKLIQLLILILIFVVRGITSSPP